LDPTPPESGPSKKVMFVAWLFLIALAIVVVVVLYRAYPAHVEPKTNPTFLDSIFENPVVLFAARLVLFSAALVLAFVAGYVIYSIVKSMSEGKRLAKFGPFQVQEAEDLSADVKMWQDLYEQSVEENAELRERIVRTDDLLEQANEGLRRSFDAAIEAVRTSLEEQGEGTPPVNS
jgi:hypothetical protein